MEENGSDDGSGAPDRANVGPDAAAHLRYASDVMEVVETYLYRPALGFFMTVAKRLQSGRLDAYLLYMLIALAARPGGRHRRGNRPGVMTTEDQATRGHFGTKVIISCRCQALPGRSRGVTKWVSRAAPGPS
jgi:hypothetical protein